MTAGVTAAGTAPDAADGERDLDGLVVVVAGASGAAGPAVLERLARAGATVVGVGSNTTRLEEAVASTRDATGSDRVEGRLADLLDPGATDVLAADVVRDHGRVDGLVHLVGGWRGGVSLVEEDLADWDWLEGLLVRTLMNTTRAFHDPLRQSPQGRLAMISTVQTQSPSATNAMYAAAKAAAETWTLAVADSFKDTGAAAVVIPVMALVTPAMREAKPEATFRRYTDVADLADTIHDLWLTPAPELNGKRLA